MRERGVAPTPRLIAAAENTAGWVRLVEAERARATEKAKVPA